MSDNIDIKLMGQETWEVRIRCGHTVLNCHHSNDDDSALRQWTYFKDVYLPTHPERVYKVGDNNAQLVQINPTTIQVLEKDSDNVKFTIDFGRRVLVKKIDGKRIPSTIKTRLVTPQNKVNKPSSADIDDIIVILGLDEQDLEISMDHWVEEFGVRITNPTQSIGNTFGTDHRTACALITTPDHTIRIQSKNICGESKVAETSTKTTDVQILSDPEEIRFNELEAQYGHMAKNIFEFMTEGAIARYNDPTNSYYRDTWARCVDQTTEDLGLFEGKTFADMWKTKIMASKTGLRNATCFNIHSLIPTSHHPRAEYLDMKFTSEYAKWNKSESTTEYSKKVAEYWMHFIGLLKADPKMVRFFIMFFDEVNSVDKITMEQDLLNEMENSRTDIICLQEVSVDDYHTLTSTEFQQNMESHGYVLSIPPFVEGTKTYGAIIVRNGMV